MTKKILEFLLKPFGIVCVVLMFLDTSYGYNTLGRNYLTILNFSLVEAYLTGAWLELGKVSLLFPLTEEYYAF